MQIKINMNQGLVSESKKRKSKRSMMLKMIMPMLSGGNGEDLANAISNENGSAAENAMKKIAKELRARLEDR